MLSQMLSPVLHHIGKSVMFRWLLLSGGSLPLRIARKPFGYPSLLGGQNFQNIEKGSSTGVAEYLRTKKVR